jgi:hypothetical protein
MVGGAIDPKKVVMKGVDPLPQMVALAEDQSRQKDMAFHNLLKNRADIAYGRLGQQLEPISNALNDYRPRNLIGFNQYANHFQRYPEEDLVSRVEPLYSGQGASKDHPKLHNLFMESFVHHPELVSLYTRS